MQSAECRTEKREFRMQNEKKDLSFRTKAFALRIIRLFRRLPRTVEAQVIGKQILRSGTSIGAQYCEAQRARSRAEFQSKLESALQELEETRYWLELLFESSICTKSKLSNLFQEQDELQAMFIASINTAKNNS